MNIVRQENSNQANSPFDSIRRLDEKGNEFWSGRELMPILGYKQWQKFSYVIDTAKENLEIAISSIVDHFLPVEIKNVDSNGNRLKGRTGLDYKLSRLACYHVALCCDSRGNDSVKMAKHYFAVKTREAETVIPQLSAEIQTLQLMLDLEREQNLGKHIDNTMLQLHGDRVVLALRGKSNLIVEKEIVVTEVVNPASGASTRILTADQLKKAIKDRTGQNLKSLKDFADTLRKAGRDDLLVPVTRSQTYEYVSPSKLDEAISIVFGDFRQKLIGE